MNATVNEPLATLLTSETGRRFEVYGTYPSIDLKSVNVETNKPVELVWVGLFPECVVFSRC